MARGAEPGEETANPGPAVYDRLDGKLDKPTNDAEGVAGQVPVRQENGSTRWTTFLPDTVKQEDGKILRIANGVWAKSDKPVYNIEYAEIPLDISLKGEDAIEMLNVNPIIPGTTYHVTVNETTYSIVAREEIDDGIRALILGDNTEVLAGTENAVYGFILFQIPQIPDFDNITSITPTFASELAIRSEDITIRSFTDVLPTEIVPFRYIELGHFDPHESDLSNALFNLFNIDIVPAQKEFCTQTDITTFNAIYALLNAPCEKGIPASFIHSAYGNVLKYTARNLNSYNTVQLTMLTAAVYYSSGIEAPADIKCRVIRLDARLELNCVVVHSFVINL